VRALEEVLENQRSLRERLMRMEFMDVRSLLSSCLSCNADQALSFSQISVCSWVAVTWIGSGSHQDGRARIGCLQ